MPEFQLLMISAMYENGGNTVHRLLDGHPQMFVYPFESQLGTQLVQDHLSSMFPIKYRWPVFSTEATPLEDYKSIIDEECRVRARTPQASKFRMMPFDFDDNFRFEIYQTHVLKTGRSRADNIAAFFKATFEAWKNFKSTDQQKIYVGYSPIVVVDADKILCDFPKAHVIHVVRNPWSAYADTKKRAVPLSLKRYFTAWAISQYYALAFREIYPESVHILRFEDVVADPKGVLGKLCMKIGLDSSDILATPTWNGAVLEEVYPWGTIRRATPEANLATAKELSGEEREQVRLWAEPYLDILDYRRLLS